MQRAQRRNERSKRVTAKPSNIDAAFARLRPSVVLQQIRTRLAQLAPGESAIFTGPDLKPAERAAQHDTGKFKVRACVQITRRLD